MLLNRNVTAHDIVRAPIIRTLPMAADRPEVMDRRWCGAQPFAIDLRVRILAAEPGDDTACLTS